MRPGATSREAAQSMQRLSMYQSPGAEAGLRSASFGTGRGKRASLEDQLEGRAAEIRAYVEAQIERSKSNGEGVVPATVETWATWALSEADRIDPLLRETPGISG